jgi:DNA polymerase I-like protein with 3'-5' exonuclease and polymerase domains
MPLSTVVVRRNGKAFITGQSQQEPRLTIHYAAEKGCTKGQEAADLYNTDPNTDYHDFVATLVFGEGFTKAQRLTAKMINLGLAYGMGGAKLCKKLGYKTKTKVGKNNREYEVAGDEGQQILDQYHAKVPFIKELSGYYMEEAKQFGYIRTLSGRRCRFSDWEPWSGGQALPYEETVKRHGAGNIKRAFTHAALNRKIQGGSADLIKITMRNLWREGLVPLVTVHDENGLSVPNKETARKVMDIMRDCVKLRVPLKVDCDLGPTWGDAKPIKEDDA